MIATCTKWVQVRRVRGCSPSNWKGKTIFYRRVSHLIQMMALVRGQDQKKEERKSQWGIVLFQTMASLQAPEEEDEGPSYFRWRRFRKRQKKRMKSCLISDGGAFANARGRR